MTNIFLLGGSLIYSGVHGKFDSFIFSQLLTAVTPLLWSQLGFGWNEVQTSVTQA